MHERVPPDAAPDPGELDPDHLSKDKGSLLGIAYAPSIWALHFLVVYGVGAVACAKTPSMLAGAAAWIVGFTAAAISGIVAVSYPAWVEWRRETDIATDSPSDEGRAHFLAHASLLLAGLSLFATLTQTMPAILAASCR